MCWLDRMQRIKNSLFEIPCLSSAGPPLLQRSALAPQPKLHCAGFGNDKSAVSQGVYVIAAREENRRAKERERGACRKKAPFRRQIQCPHQSTKAVLLVIKIHRERRSKVVKRYSPRPACGHIHDACPRDRRRLSARTAIYIGWAGDPPGRENDTEGRPRPGSQTSEAAIVIVQNIFANLHSWSKLIVTMPASALAVKVRIPAINNAEAELLISAHLLLS